MKLEIAMNKCLGWIALSVLIASSAYANECSVPVSESSRDQVYRALPKKFFGLHVINLEEGAAFPNIRFSSWRSFTSQWYRIETAPNVWNFKKLDKEMALAEQHGIQMHLVLQRPPTWESARPDERLDTYSPPGTHAEPKEMLKWRDYIKQVASRYKGKVFIYELWNEPDQKNTYSGAIEKLVELSRVAYETLKEIDPNIIVVSPSMSRAKAADYLDRYLEQGGGRYADVIGFHFYLAPFQPEVMVKDVDRVKKLLAKHNISKPLWNTEIGWRIANSDRNIDGELWAGAPLSNEQSVAYLARSYLLAWATGVERVYWYAWGHRSMGMTEYDLNAPKPIARAYEELQKWLMGRNVGSCTVSDDLTWRCELSDRQRKSATILWKQQGSCLLKGDLKQYSRIRDLSGRSTELRGEMSFQISGTPLLLERDE